MKRSVKEATRAILGEYASADRNVDPEERQRLLAQWAGRWGQHLLAEVSAMHDAYEPGPQHTRECGTACRGCAPDCPARANECVPCDGWGNVESGGDECTACDGTGERTDR